MKKKILLEGWMVLSWTSAHFDWQRVTWFEVVVQIFHYMSFWNVNILIPNRIPGSGVPDLCATWGPGSRLLPPYRLPPLHSPTIFHHLMQRPCLPTAAWEHSPWANGRTATDSRDPVIALRWAAQSNLLFGQPQPLALVQGYHGCLHMSVQSYHQSKFSQHRDFSGWWWGFGGGRVAEGGSSCVWDRIGLEADRGIIQLFPKTHNQSWEDVGKSFFFCFYYQISDGTCILDSQLDWNLNTINSC